MAFEPGVFLLTKAKAQEVRTTADDRKPLQRGRPPSSTATMEPSSAPGPSETQIGLPIETGQKATVRLKGTVPPEVWNRLGTRILPKLRSGDDLSVGVDLSVSVDASIAQGFELDLQQALADLGLQGQVSVHTSNC